MNSFLKNFFIALASVVIVSSVMYKMHEIHIQHIEQEKIEKHKEAQKIIQEFIAWVDCASIQTEEQIEIDKCGDDLEAVKGVFLRITEHRRVFWKTELERCEEDKRTFENRIRGLSPYYVANYMTNADIKRLIEVEQQKKKAIVEAFEQSVFWETKHSEIPKWKPAIKKEEKKNVDNPIAPHV